MNAIKGFDVLFKGDIPRGSVILVTGIEGALKSGFVFDMMSNYLAGTNEHGLYTTLEETEESHLRNMKSLGIKKLDRMHIFDYKDIRHELGDEELDMLKVTEDVINFYKEKYENLTIFALDSLNAFYSLSTQLNLRKNMYRFFTMLREKNLTSFLVLETCSPSLLEPPEYFLADGIIELGIVEAKENGKDVKRYIQIRKMRAANHSMEKHQVMVGKDGLYVAGF